MNKTLRTIAIIVVIILVIAMPIIGGYNKMVSLDQKVNATLGDIDTQL